ncbi:tetratricopeptide repeat protein [Desulfospira joergensenii]|uniref:tetratricopeptide repeat protein n=1 Tax=Desulfospira joergensenii TaxID=53329 RepID=UPI0003B46F0B|nr:tetratricopeptide repeat protein [Desulfospira joergensenii]
MNKSPYPGLRPFKWDESDLFFGREEQCDQLIDKLAGNRFIAVVGPSGCGKSSLVRAGLIADLNSGYMGTDRDYWEIIKMRPGRWPLKRLSNAFRKALTNGKSGNEGSSEIHCVLSGIIGEIEAAGGVPGDTNIFLLVDQFEEIFRLSTEGNFTEAGAFVSLLLDLAGQDKFPVYVVITMRTDYIGDCTLFRGLPEAINQGLFLTPRLNREQLHDAIVGPARVFGGDVDYLLVDRLLKTVGPDPDQLPLMQHVLMRTYDHVMEQKEKKRPGSDETFDFKLTLEAYETMGGIEHALSNHADEAYEEALKLDVNNPDHITETLFRCLSLRDKGQRDIRNPAKVSYVARVSGVDDSEVEKIVNIFLENNFIVLFSAEAEQDPGPDMQQNPEPALGGKSINNSSPVLDISHESLIRQWEKMCGTKTEGKEKEGWVDLEAKKAETYRRLAEDAKCWAMQPPEKKGDYLAEKRSLDHAVAWRNEENPNEHWSKKYDRPLANAQSRELAHMYDKVLANRQDENLFENYKKERDKWCETRFNLAMKFLDQSITKKENSENIRGIIKVVMVLLIIAAVFVILIVAKSTLPKMINTQSQNLEKEARELATHQKLPDAVEKYYEAILHTPDISRLHNGLAGLYIVLGRDYEKKGIPESGKCVALALEKIQIAQTKQFWILQFYNRLASILDSSYKNPLEETLDPSQTCIDLAKKKFKRAVELDQKKGQKNIEALNGLGTIYLESKQIDKAKTSFDEVIKTDPENITALNGLAALSSFELNSANPKERSLKAEAAIQNYFNAYKNLEQHSMIQNFITTCMGIGDIYTSTGKYEAALKYYRKSHLLNPKDPSILNKMGHAYAKLGEYDNALEQYNKAMNLFPENGQKNTDRTNTYSGLGAVYTKMGKFDHAIVAYTKSKDIDPENPFAYTGLGIAWLGRNAFNRADQNFITALGKIPENQESSMLSALISIGRGYALQGLNDPVEAKKRFQEACRTNPGALKIFNTNNIKIFREIPGHPLRIVENCP